MAGKHPTPGVGQARAKTLALTWPMLGWVRVQRSLDPYDPLVEQIRNITILVPKEDTLRCAAPVRP